MPTLLLAAYAVFWLLPMLLIASIASRQRKLAREMETLRAELSERQIALPSTVPSDRAPELSLER
ncbi:MAG: hypothetical protein ACYC5M_01730 [Anaerolineae bacterium]